MDSERPSHGNTSSGVVRKQASNADMCSADVNGQSDTDVPFDKFRQVVDNMDQAALVTDWDGNLVYLNDSCARLFGSSEGDIIGHPLTDLLSDAEEEATPGIRLVYQTVRETGYFKDDVLLFDRQQTPLWVQVVASAVRNEAGENSYVMACVSDITFTKLREELQHGIFKDMLADRPIAETMEHFCCEIEQRLDGFCMSVVRRTDQDTINVLAGPALPQWYHLLIEGVLLGPRAGSCGTAMWRAEQVMVSDIHTHPLWEAWREGIVDLEFKSCWSTPIMRSDGSVIGAFALYSREARAPNAFHRKLIDICSDLCTLAFERHEAQEQLRFMAQHDPLTGLCNREHFMTALDQAVGKADERGATLSLYLMRFSGFKDISSFADPVAGDHLLTDFARALTDRFPEQIIARLGDAEFAVLTNAIADLEDVESGAQDLLELARQAHHSNAGPHQRIKMTVGYALYPDDARTGKELFQRASMALYHSRHDGEGWVRRFAPDYAFEISRRRSLEKDLRRTLTEDYGQLWVAYQPQVRVDDGSLMGFEALARWDHPDLGSISPAMFIPIAEEANLIGMLSWHILREACLAAVNWPADISLAVNISGLNLTECNFHHNICSILMDTGLSPNRLELEITESVLIRDRKRALHALRQIKMLSVRIAMDDFGTGYSSLSYIHDFPFDKIKIDRSFISTLGMGSHGSAIVRTIVGLGRALDIPVLAEGVESREQLEVLRSEGCDFAQGFLLGTPMKADKACSLANSGSSLAPASSNSSG